MSPHEPFFAKTATVLLLAGAVGAPGLAWAEVYTCTDKQGRRLTSDRPIPECVDREQRVLDHVGTERRRIGPTLTEHERAAQEAGRRREAERQARIAEQRRRDRVLLARYPDKPAHQAEREEALTQVDGVIEVARKRIAELGQQRKKLDTEMEFYRRDPTKAPMTLQRQIAANEHEIEEQERFIAAQGQEKIRIHERFDMELAQLRQLWRARDAAMETIRAHTPKP